MNDSYQWVDFYQEFANKLLEYENRRGELFELIKELSSDQPLMRYLHFEREEWWGPKNYQIDPFTVIGIMNRGTTDANRILLASILADTFEIKVRIPKEFTGIPVLNPMNSIFAGVDELWNLFISALEVREIASANRNFKSAFEKAIGVTGNGLTSITIALFWVRPNIFMPLDGNSRIYISENYGLKVPMGHCSGDEYIKFLQDFQNLLKAESSDISFPVVSHTAWTRKDSDTGEGTDRDTQSSQDTGSRKIEGHDLTTRNIILYGPPGTGKTYTSVHYAVAIIEEKPLMDIKAEKYEAVFSRYLKYKEDGLIAFTTFHQSYSYEEFIEGIRPVVLSEDRAEDRHEIEYEIHDGIFKAFCDKAGTPISRGKNIDLGLNKNPTVWKVSLEGTGNNPTRDECFANGHIRIGYDIYGEKLPDYYEKGDNGRNILNAFYYKMQVGDIVFSCYSNRTIDAIGIVTGEPEWNNEYPQYKRLRKVKWLVKGINEDIYELNSEKLMMQPSVYRLSIAISDVLQLLQRLKPSLFTPGVKIPKRVFIIDEINRGNISKIFGELITLIEPSKRLGANEELRSILPYSGQSFGVPDNVFIIGTMNTADRSIAMIDVALRRRFDFVEVMPEPALLKDIFVDGIDIEGMLYSMNKRIAILLDRDHTVGHSYFLSLKGDPSLANLASIFEKKIVPLLQEYFYDDYEKIQLVLGDNQKNDDSIRFIIKNTDTARIFGNADLNFSEYFEVNKDSFMRADAYEYF